MLETVAQLVDGATGPALTISLLRQNGVTGLTSAVDLTGYTSVVAWVSRAAVNLPLLVKNCVVLNPPTAGQVQLQWAVGDLQNATGNAVTYQIDLVLTAADGSQEQLPEPMLVKVRPNVT